MLASYSTWLDKIQYDCISYDLQSIRAHCVQLQNRLKHVDFRFAVKACPQTDVLKVIAGTGFGFDIASPEELNLALSAGGPVGRIHYGNTIKSLSDIKYAYKKGIRDYVTDSLEDLVQIANGAPNSRIFCRLVGTGEGALWGLKDKFGCLPEQALALMVKARSLGLIPAGISIHVGSQQMLPEVWSSTLKNMTMLNRQLKEHGIQPLYFNLGGGLPASGYLHKDGAPMRPSLEGTLEQIKKGIVRLQEESPHPLKFMMEPGRNIVADFGVLRTHVVRFSERINASGKKVFWLFLSCGRFNGLYEADALQYQLAFPSHPNSLQMVPAVLAGPTCDSDDVLNDESRQILVPARLKAGDPVWFLSCGAYSTSYSTAFFNGFSPLPVLCHDEERVAQ